VTPALDDHQMEVLRLGFVHGLILGPGRYEGKVAGPKLVSYRLFVVSLRL
jgi:hypothetical protein